MSLDYKMSVLSEMKRHNVHWFIGVVLVLYLIAHAAGVKPVHLDQLPHAEVAAPRELTAFG